MNRPSPRLGVVAGLLLLLTATGSNVDRNVDRNVGSDVGSDVGGPPSQVAVERAAAVCPDLRQGAGLTSSVAVGLAPLADREQDGATALVERQVVGAPTERSALPVAVPGSAAAGLGTTLDGSAYAVEAVDVEGAGAAAGLVVVATAEGGDVGARGVAWTDCAVPATSTWLLGGGATVGESAVLVLANPEQVEAAVDVLVLSAEGVADARRGRGLTVPARDRLVVDLGELAPDRTALAVRVTATRGRVAAALSHSRAQGTTPRGLASAVQGEPAQELVVPGLPAGPGARRVLVANPGELDVVVSLELTGGDGQFVVGGLDPLTVPAGSTVLADVAGALADTPGAVRVRSPTGPVLAAGLVVETGEDPAGPADLAWVAAVPALSGPALLPDLPLDGSTVATLLLSAVGGDAVVDVALGAVAGGQVPAGPPRRVEVPGGRTVTVPLAELAPPDFRGRATVSVSPDPVGSAVHAAVLRVARPAEGPLVAALALRSGRPDVPAARAVRDPGVRLDVP